MKKFMLLAVVACVAGLVSGCGQEKTLVCKMSDSESGVDMEQTSTVKFKGKEVISIISEVDATLSEELVDYKDLFVSTLEAIFEEYEDLSGVSVKTEDTGDDTVKVTMSVDVTEMDDDSKEKFDLVDTTAAYDDVKKTFEDEGYTCE